MNQVFYISELCIKIMNMLGLNDQLRLGLTCKAIWAVAVPEMWRSIPKKNCPTALFGLFPRDIKVTRDNLENPKRKVVLSRALTDKEWQPMLKYCRHIHHLVLSDELRGDGPMLQHALFVLSTYSGVVPALPKLRSLDLALYDPVSAAASMVVINKPVRKLKIWLRELSEPYWDWLCANILPVLGHKELHDLHLWVEGNGDDGMWIMDGVEDQFRAVLRRAPNIETLFLASISNGKTLFPALAKLPDLKTLTVDPTSFDEPIMTYTLPSRPFMRLKKLAFQCHENSFHLDYTSLLCGISSPSLEAFEFTSCDVASVKQVMAIITERWSSTFTSLDTRFGMFQQELEISYPLELLLPLLGCPRLERLWLNSSIRLDFSDEDFDRIASAWPKLVTLMLHCGSFDKSWTPKATRRSLFTFATRLSFLRVVSVSINYDSEDVSRHSEISQFDSTSQVRYIDLDRSSCTELAGAADYLRLLFPRLRGIGVLNPEKEHISAMMGIEGYGWKPEDYF